MTTMKVRTSTRDVVVAAARQEGMTVDEYLSYLLNEVAWRQRLDAAQAAMSNPDTEYLEETAAWDDLE